MRETFTRLHNFSKSKGYHKATREPIPMQKSRRESHLTHFFPCVSLHDHGTLIFLLHGCMDVRSSSSSSTGGGSRVPRTSVRVEGVQRGPKSCPVPPAHLSPKNGTANGMESVSGERGRGEVGEILGWFSTRGMLRGWNKVRGLAGLVEPAARTPAVQSVQDLGVARRRTRPFRCRHPPEKQGQGSAAVWLLLPDLVSVWGFGGIPFGC